MVDIEKDIVTAINPTELINKNNIVLSVKLDDFKYESRKLNRIEEAFLTGSVKNVINTTYAGSLAYEIEFTNNDFVTTNNVALNNFIRLSGNNEYLRVINIKTSSKIVVTGALSGNLIGSSVFRFTHIVLDKEFRDSYTSKEILIYTHSNNHNGYLQYDEYGNFLTTDKKFIKACDFMSGFKDNTGLLIHNDIENKACIIYDTFEDFTSKAIEGTYLINTNENINFKVNAYRKQLNFLMGNFIVIPDLATNDIYEVQLNGTRLESGLEYEVVYNENKIIFKGAFLNNFSNNVNLILYSRNQDLSDNNIKVSLVVDGYNEQYIEHDVELYIKDTDRLKFMDSLNSGSSFSVEEIERSDVTMNYEKILGSKNKATFKQFVASDLSQTSPRVVIDNLLYYVGGYNKKFRIIRIDNLFKRIEYYNDCEIVDSIQKTSQPTGEEYNFTIKYKTREEFEFKPTSALNHDSNNLVLVSNN